MNLATDLDGAITRGEFAAAYQPQIDVDSGQIVGVEALARWNHPAYGPIPPATFIPVAEQHEHIAAIGRFMIDDGCRRAAEWNSLGHRVDVAVNVSAAQLLTLELLDRIAENLETYGLAPDRLVVEITESLPVIDVPEVTAGLLHLRGLGLGISIDDFGTGYSSLSRLESVPATEIKLDRSLVRGTATPDAVIRDVIDKAHEMGLRVVAEGVETEEEEARVRRLGCDRAQGYLYSRPTTGSAITRLLSDD